MDKVDLLLPLSSDAPEEETILPYAETFNYNVFIDGTAYPVDPSDGSIAVAELFGKGICLVDTAGVALPLTIDGKVGFPLLPGESFCATEARQHFGLCRADVFQDLDVAAVQIVDSDGDDLEPVHRKTLPRDRTVFAREGDSNDAGDSNGAFRDGADGADSVTAEEIVSAIGGAAGNDVVYVSLPYIVFGSVSSVAAAKSKKISLKGKEVRRIHFLDDV